MCSPATCSSCGKATYTGCGMHVEQVLGNVPPAERCRCREERAEGRAKDATAGGGAGPKSWLRRLLGE
jgi:hypothetical protein